MNTWFQEQMSDPKYNLNNCYQNNIIFILTHNVAIKKKKKNVRDTTNFIT